MGFKKNMKKLQSKSQISHHGQEGNQSDPKPQLQVQNQSELGSQNSKTVCLGGQSMADNLGNHINSGISDSQKSETPGCNVNPISNSQTEHKDYYTNQGEINMDDNMDPMWQSSYPGSDIRTKFGRVRQPDYQW